MNLIVIGPPGAGKGSQIAELLRYRDFEHISLGDIFRVAQFTQSQLGKHVSASVDAGELVDDETANTVVRNRILELPNKVGFLLDGYPRSKQQAVSLCQFLDKEDIRLNGVFELDVSDEIASERIRKHAQLSKKTIVPHSDENEAAIKNRLLAYRSSIGDVRAKLAEIAPIYRIDASLSIDAITSHILSHIELIDG